MTSFQNFSIRSKFLLAVIFTVLIALLIALASIATLRHTLASKDFTEQLNVLVDITAERSQIALAFRDKKTVIQNLQTLSKLTSIDVACMYNSEDNVFGQYERFETTRCPETTPNQLEYTESRSDFSVAKEMIVNNRYMGTLYVEANSKDVNRRLIKFIMYAGLIIAFTSLIAYLLAYKIQSTLTMPIIKLSNLAKEIGRTKDFSLRAKVFNEDEAGYLAKSFNGLIHNIQESQMQMEDLVFELQEKKKQLESHTELVEGRNKTIKNMFAGASHDLKQPLQAMTLFVHALSGISDSPQKALLGKLELAIQNMKSLFEDLLDVSKLESRLENIQTGPVELKPILDNVFHEFEVIAADKSLILKFHAKDFIVDSDSRMLERIIRNLLSNAIRYTTTGGVLLACRKRKGYASIEVWDTGIGIPKENLDSIFQRFYQVEQEQEKGQQGYGLGLSIVKRLSGLLKHPIEVQSTYGRGTLFRILVPIAEPEKASQTRSTFQPLTSLPIEVSEQEIMLPRNELKVLLIDDDPLVLDSLKSLISSWGMQVNDFESISDMNNFLEQNTDYHCDMIVSDFQLSETENGLDAISVVRKKLGKSTPALIVSATDDSVLIKIIKESGIRRLKKPVKPAKLRALINHLSANDNNND